MVFSDSTNNTGIVERARIFARVDATQWPTSRIVNSVNDRLDTILNYGRGADKRFELDDTNHTKLPIGTSDLVANQSDYSFLTDEQNNRITNITSLSLIEIATNKETKLEPINRNDPEYSYSSFGITIGTPTQYDKIADNIIKLDTLPSDDDVATYKIKFYFQRTPSYFIATDITKEPGFANELHRGCVIQAAYDAAFTLGLDNLGTLAVELEKENKVMESYFQNRNTDEPKYIRPVMTSAR
jgi:hypothetical protein